MRLKFCLFEISQSGALHDDRAAAPTHLPRPPPPSKKNDILSRIVISPLSSRGLKTVVSNSLSVSAPSHDARGRNANGGGWQSVSQLVGRSVGARKASLETDGQRGARATTDL